MTIFSLRDFIINGGNSSVSDAAERIIAEHIARMYGGLSLVKFYLNFAEERGWETASISFYKAEQNCWPVGKNEHCVGVTALGLTAGKKGDDSRIFVETIGEAIGWDWEIELKPKTEPINDTIDKTAIRRNRREMSTFGMSVLVGK